MSQPSDQSERDRFGRELENNFSVIAAAGSGKTRAITDRIAQIARSPHALKWLPTLVVVTFTHRAADEMQRRARQKILEAGVPLDVVAAFNRAFFGTIHSFCVRLLADYGHYLGLPPHLSLITDDAELWHRFVQSQTSIGQSLTAESRSILLRHVPVRQLMELGRAGGIPLPESGDVGPCPPLDLAALYAFSPPARSADKIERGQAELREWERLYRAGVDFLPLLDRPSSAKEFVALWDLTFGPFRKWLNCSALAVAAEVQGAYREFRLDHGVFTYDDQIRLADALMQQPTAARRVRERNFRVILDEAQDTDPQQFSILLEITRPPAAQGTWLESRAHAPRPGHFCMVGDFQQSIFGDRADLRQYRRIHDSLIETGAGQAVELAVTFRLDQRQVNFINAAFPCLLSDTDGQVRFVELNPRPAVLPGQVIALPITDDAPGGEKKSERVRADLEARQIAAWLRETTLECLRARSWSEVAILCPRKAWFPPLRQALRQVGFEVQTQSESELNADNPAHAWLTALATIMAQPHLYYETVGVLRDVFGLSDHDLALFCQGQANRFDFQNKISGDGAVAKALATLASLRRSVLNAPLYDAVCAIVKGVRLRERLVSLPAREFGDLSNELDRLLIAAAAAEAEGKTLADFARDLRANFDAPRESEPAQRDAIQLITGQKAKGSEWDAVLLPFLCREVRTRSSDYARIIRLLQTGELIVALGRDDMSREVKDALKLADRQEMERLLYVAFTRARHTLVLALDHAIFQTAQGTAPKNSQARWLRSASAEANAEQLEQLATQATGCAATAAGQAEEKRKREKEEKLPPWPAAGMEVTRAGSAQAARFVRKLTPSRIASSAEARTSEGADVWKETDPELRPLTVEGAAIRYGIWWHDFAQRIPWLDGEPAQENIFRQFQSASPDPARSLREWKLLRDQCLVADALPGRLLRAAALWRAELPFLWPVDQNACVEGIIDLAVFDKERKRVCLIDWKTNRVAPKDSDELRARYRSQIAAYWQAMTQLTDLTVEAAIYSTATGQFLLYETADLAGEWERLRQLPAAEWNAIPTPA